MGCWCTQKSREENKNLPFQRTRWRFGTRSGVCSAMSGSDVSSLVGVVTEIAGMITGVRLIASAVGVDTGVLLGVRGTLFGVVGGVP